MSSILKYVLAAVYLFMLLWCLLFFVFDKIETVFNVSATTEILRCYFPEVPISPINIHNANVWNYDDQLLTDFTGKVEIGAGVDLTVERIGTGPLHLELECDDCESVGSIISTDGTRAVSGENYLYVKIDDVDSLRAIGQSIIIPYTGKVTLGNSVEIELLNTKTPILIDGLVSMAGISNVKKRPFLAGEEQLHLGDMIEFNDAIGIGFAYLDESPSFRTAFRVQTREGVILKAGPKTVNSGYHVHATYYDRFRSDAFFQGMSLFFGVLLIFVTIADFSINYIQYRNPNNK